MPLAICSFFSLADGMIGTRNVSIPDRTQSQDICLKSFSSLVGLIMASEMGIKIACRLNDWMMTEIQMKSAFLVTFSRHSSIFQSPFRRLKDNPLKIKRPFFNHTYNKKPVSKAMLVEIKGHIILDNLEDYN